jgi:hypothetical protein
MKKLLLATATCLAFVGMANACETTTTTRICYLRNYDRAHLAQHPGQSVTAMRISLSPLEEDSYWFDLSVSFREDKDKWSWGIQGACERFGPGMTYSTLRGGCDITLTYNDFYIENKPKSIYLYPKHIEMANNDVYRTLTKGKDDEVFRLDKTVCWKVKVEEF